MTAASPLRLRRVRFKTGGEVRLIHPVADTVVRDGFRTMVERIGNNSVAAEMAGYAIVAWSRRGEVSVDYHNGAASPVAGGAVAEYVKDVLLAETAVRWSRD